MAEENKEMLLEELNELAKQIDTTAIIRLIAMAKGYIIKKATSD